MEIYVSVDIEADGPMPGPHSMLCFAAIAMNIAGDEIAQFTANLEMLPGATGHPDTLRFWSTQPDAWAAHRHDLRDPADVMPAFAKWVRGLPGRAVFVGYPASFDFLFIQWYLYRFANDSPFGFVALDVKSFAMAVLKTDFRDTIKPAMPTHWFGPTPHTHIALDDAREQGVLFVNMLRESRGLPVLQSTKDETSPAG